MFPKRRQSGFAKLRNRGVIPLLTGVILVASGMMCTTSPIDFSNLSPNVATLLRPAPGLPVGDYDYFGSLKSSAEAREMVAAAGLDPEQPGHYARIGLVHITPELIAEGRDLFFKQQIGDPFTLNNILGLLGIFDRGILELALDSFDPSKDPTGALAFVREVFITSLTRGGGPVTNLRVRLTNDLHIGSRIIPAGTILDTGLDVAEGELIPVGLESGTITCALCHASVDPQTGRTVAGRPNNDLNINLFITLASNTASVFLRLTQDDISPLDPGFPRTGRTILDSHGNEVTLPDPVAFETAIDDFLFDASPFGGFEAAPDGITSVTKIPDAFTFGEGGMGWDGGFGVGPFAGVAAFSNAVHSFEINLLTPANFSERAGGIDSEVYLGIVLQNAADPSIRVPDGVTPSQWLAQVRPQAERESHIVLPTYPDPSLFSLNGLVFSPPGKSFMRDVLALSAFQQSLNIPPNQSPENLIALLDGSVVRGTEVFLAAGCAECHPAPFFTTGGITSNSVVKANNARASNRRVLDGLLRTPVLPSFDQPVPLPPVPNYLTLPAEPNSARNTSLPPGLDQDPGGYKIISLRGVYFKPPYLHDGGVAVGVDALNILEDGSFEIADAAAVGVPGTTLIPRPVSAANSLRALLDRDLRAILVANNRANAQLVRANIEGTGHEFFVDPGAGFTYAQQADLIAFLLALDDDPGRY